MTSLGKEEGGCVVEVVMRICYLHLSSTQYLHHNSCGGVLRTKGCHFHMQCNLSKVVTVLGSHLSTTASLPGPK